MEPVPYTPMIVIPSIYSGTNRQIQSSPLDLICWSLTLSSADPKIRVLVAMCLQIQRKLALVLHKHQILNPLARCYTQLAGADAVNPPCR